MVWPLNGFYLSALHWWVICNLKMKSLYTLIIYDAFTRFMTWAMENQITFQGFISKLDVYIFLQKLKLYCITFSSHSTKFIMQNFLLKGLTGCHVFLELGHCNWCLVNSEVQVLCTCKIPYNLSWKKHCLAWQYAAFV